MARTELEFNLKASGSQGLIRLFNNLDTQAKAYKRTISELQRDLNILQRSNNNSQKAIISKQLTGNAKDFAGAIRVLNKDLDRFRAKSLQAEKGAEKFRKEILTFKDSSTSILGLNNRIDRLVTKYRELNAVARAGSAGKELLKDITEATRQAELAQTQLDRATARRSNSSNRNGGLFGNSGRLLLQIAQYQLLSQAIQQFVEIALGATQTVVDFEAAQKNLQGILNISASEMNSLTNEALRLGQSTAFTAEQATQLFTELAKLGFTKGEIQAAGAAVVDFAVATRVQIPRAAQLAGSTLRSFGLEATEMKRVLDVLTRSTTISALSFDKLETELPIVAAAAAGVNLDLEETVGILAVLADRGVQATTAATSLRNILIESEKRGFRDYRDALEEIEGSTDKLTVAFDLFGKRGAVQALILAENVQEVERQVEKLRTESEDAASALAKIQLESIAGQVTLLTSAWDGLILAFDKGDGVISNLSRGLISGLRDEINLLTASIERGEVSFLTLIEQFKLGGANTTGAFVSQLGRADEAVNEYIQSIQKLDDVTFARTTQQDLINLFRNAQFSAEQANQKAEEFFEEEAKRRAARRERLTQEAREIEIVADTILGLDVNRLTTIRSLTEAEEALSDARNIAVIGSERMAAIDAQLLKIRARLAQVNGTRTDQIKEETKDIEFYTKKIQELFKTLQNTTNEGDRQGILKDISEAEAILAGMRGEFDAFLNKVINSSTNIPEIIQEASLKNFQERIQKETDAEKLSLKLTEDRETVLNEKLKKLDLERQLQQLEFQQRLAVNDQELSERLTKEIQEVKDRLSTADLSIDLEIRRDSIAKEFQAERAQVLLTAQVEEEQKIRLFDLELRQQIKLREAELQTIDQTTAEYKEKLAEINNLKRQSQEVSARAFLGIDQDAAAREIQGIANIISAQDLYTQGLINYEEYQEKIKEIKQQVDSANLQSEVELQAAILATRVNTSTATAEDYQRYLEAVKAKNDAEIGDEKRKTREILRQQNRLLRETLKYSRDVGDALGDVLTSSTETLDESLEVLADRLIDYLTNVVEAQVIAAITGVSIEAGRALATFDAATLARIAPAIVAIRAASALFKSQIKKLFEAGDVLGDGMYAERGVQIKSGKRGHRVRGRRHRNGGEPFMHRGVMHEYEDGEVVINRRSAALFMPQLSAINSYKGWGKKFASGDILGSPPQILAPRQNNTSEVDYNTIAQTIAASVGRTQADVLEKYNAILVQSLGDAIENNERLRERIKQAQQQSLV